jgi:hypothetical protein
VSRVAHLGCFAATAIVSEPLPGHLRRLQPAPRSKLPAHIAMAVLLNLSQSLGCSALPPVGVLHTIIFNRSLGYVVPKEVDTELFDVTYVRHLYVARSQAT